MGLKNTEKIVLGLVLSVLLLIVWGLYPLFFKWLMIGLGTDKVKLADFGSLGDIYGSLTALFTSATLIIVLYSAYLQREANKDARDTMAKQLRQARNATRKQIRQSQLATRRQLALAQATHDAQMKESRHAIFSSTFNILLNQKKTVLDSIYTGKEEFKPKYIFELMGAEFEEKIVNSWSNLNHKDKFDEDIIFNHSQSMLNDEIEKSFSFNELISYFYMYVPLLLLIKNSSLNTNDKKIFYMVLSHSMTHYEQVTLLWFITFCSEIKDALKDTQLFDTKFEEESMEFIMRNFDQSLFSHPDVIEYWDEKSKQETPA